MIRKLLITVMAVLFMGVAAGVSFGDLPPLPIDPLAPKDDGGPSLAVAASAELKGLLRLTKGECTATGTKGTYFQMIDRSGSPITNTDSPCANKSLNPLTPGSEGGLSTTGFQPHSASVFDGNGNGLTRRITLPAKFFNVDFAVATNAKDPQTKLGTVVPRVLHDGNGNILADSDLRAFSAAWNGNQASQAAGEGHYNQGSPKPDGQTPGLTKKPSGTYNSSTRAFAIDWTSMIVGGAFDQNGGRWHLEGTFDPAVVIGDPAPQTTSVKSGRSPRPSAVDGLASTGPGLAPAAGAVLLGAGSAGLGLALMIPQSVRRGRRRTLRRRAGHRSRAGR